MKLSETGEALIKKWEGLRLEAYQCTAHKWTIGWGHTGPEVVPGMKIDLNTAQALFDMDVKKFEKCVKNATEIPLTQNQFDALVSFSFNLGCDALRRSTLLRKLNAHNSYEASEEFCKWVYAGGKASEGLANRRREERDLFLKEDKNG